MENNAPVPPGLFDDLIPKHPAQITFDGLPDANFMAGALLALAGSSLALAVLVFLYRKRRHIKNIAAGIPVRMACGFGFFFSGCYILADGLDGGCDTYRGRGGDGYSCSDFHDTFSIACGATLLLVSLFIFLRRRP